METYGTLVGLGALVWLCAQVAGLLHYAHRYTDPATHTVQAARAVRLACAFIAVNAGIVLLTQPPEHRGAPMLCTLGTAVGHVLTLGLVVPWLVALGLLVAATRTEAAAHISRTCYHLSLLGSLTSGVAAGVLAGCDRALDGYASLRTLSALAYLLWHLCTAVAFVWVGLYTQFQAARVAMSFSDWLLHGAVEATWQPLVRHYPWRTSYAGGYLVLLVAWLCLNPLFNDGRAAVTLGWFVAYFSLGNYALYASGVEGQELDVLLRQHALYYENFTAGEASEEGVTVAGEVSEEEVAAAGDLVNVD